MINVINEVSRCLLCNDAPCTRACTKALDPARGIRALLFEDNNAAPSFFNEEDCSSCTAPCEEACIHYDFPIRIKELAKKVGPESSPGKADLSIDFCGVHCENPFFLASSVIANNYEMIAKAFDMGWGGVVFKTVSFLDIKEVSPRFDQVGKVGIPFIGFRNMEQVSEHRIEEDFAVIFRLKKDYPGKVIVASIMGSDEQGVGDSCADGGRSRCRYGRMQFFLPADEGQQNGQRCWPEPGIFVVLDKDVLEMEAQGKQKEIFKVNVANTWFEGNQVYPKQ